MKIGFALLVLATLSSAAPAAHAAEDIRIMECTVDFKQAGRLAWQRSQEQGWFLPVDKGSTKLGSLGDVKITLAKKLVKDVPHYRLAVSQAGKSLGTVQSENTSFEFSTGLELHVDDGEDGTNYDQVKITCEPGYAAG